MRKEAFFIMITLLASCWSFTPPTPRLRIDHSHSNRMSTHHATLSMSLHDDIPLQFVSVDDKQSRRQNKFVVVKKAVLTSLVS